MNAPSDTKPAGPARQSFLGLEFDALHLGEAMHWISDKVGEQRFVYVVTPNVDHVVRYNNRRQAEPGLAAAYGNADLMLCDSRILALLAARSGRDLPVVPGSDLTHRIITGKGPWRRLAVVGGDEAVHTRLTDAFPQYTWQFHQPPMGVRNDLSARSAIRDFVESAQADIVFFAIGAPQSEICCYEIAIGGRAKGVALCIGASLEFVTGAKQRAPGWMQAARLEWLHRLVSEPRRLWRRYLVEGPRILAIWWRSSRR